jgi:adenosylmethionine-8-amino-7-oxononanoate aminotransferase
MVVSEKLRPWLEDHEFASGLTACGHPLACAAGVATIGATRDERLVENAAAMGDVLAAVHYAAARHAAMPSAAISAGVIGMKGVWARVMREPVRPAAMMTGGWTIRAPERCETLAYRRSGRGSPARRGARRSVQVCAPLPR